jgi:hypothetical protein
LAISNTIVRVINDVLIAIACFNYIVSEPADENLKGTQNDINVGKGKMNL